MIIYYDCIGNPRRKLHQTELSGFRVFRPTTRDLLFKPSGQGNYSEIGTVSPNIRQHSRPTSTLSSPLPLSKLKAAKEQPTRKLTFDKVVKYPASIGSQSKKLRDKGSRKKGSTTRVMSTVAS